MGIFSGLFKSRDKPQNRTAGSSYTFFMGGTTSGKAVTERSAMQMTAVYSCVRILAEAVAGLPLHVYKYNGNGGKEKALDHPLYRLLHDEPNPEMSSFVFRETLMTHLLLWGNAYAQVIRNGRGEIIALYLTYSLRRLGLDYIDLYEPARQDTTVPVEDLVGAIAEQVKAGYVKHIGLSHVTAEELRRAHAVHPIHTVEMEYSLIDRDIEKELISTAKELGVKVLAHGVTGGGLLRDGILGDPVSPRLAHGLLAPDHRENNLAMVRNLKVIAEEKSISLSQLGLAWSLAKYDHVQSLIGTTNPAHLQESIDALNIEFTAEDISRIEAALNADKVGGKGMRNFVFIDGIMSLA